MIITIKIVNNNKNNVINIKEKTLFLYKKAQTVPYSKIKKEKSFQLKTGIDLTLKFQSKVLRPSNFRSR